MNYYKRKQNNNNNNNNKRINQFIYPNKKKMDPIHLHNNKTKKKAPTKFIIQRNLPIKIINDNNKKLNHSMAKRSISNC